MNKFMKVFLVGAGLSLATTSMALADTSVSIHIGGVWRDGYRPPIQRYHVYDHYESHSYIGPSYSYEYQRYARWPQVRGHSSYRYPHWNYRSHAYDRYPRHGHSYRYDRYCR